MHEYQCCKVSVIISSQDLSELTASITKIWVNPLDLAFASLAQLSLVRSTAVSVSINQSSNFVESYSLNTAMSHSKELVRFVCYWVVHKVLMYWHTTSPKGLVGRGEGCGCSTRERFCSSCYMQSKLSAGLSSLASTHWHKSLISLMSAVNLAWLLGISPLGWPSASDPLVISSSLIRPLLMPSVSSMWRLMSLSMWHPAPPWWVAIVCVLYVVQYAWYLFPSFLSTVLNGECIHSLFWLQCPDMCRAVYVNNTV